MNKPHINGEMLTAVGIEIPLYLDMLPPEKPAVLPGHCLLAVFKDEQAAGHQIIDITEEEKYKKIDRVFHNHNKRITLAALFSVHYRFLTQG